MRIRRTVYFCLLLAAFNSHAASFNCGVDLSKTETIICDVPELSELDDVLLKTYGLALNASPNRDALRKEQRRWLTTVRNRCTHAECLFKAYSDRIIELEFIWEKKTRESRGVPDLKKPFEGRWESCQIYKGDEICSSYLLVQDGARVCGEWEYWATNRIYSGQLQAVQNGPSQAKLSLICGTPGSETSTDCDNTALPKGRWENAKGGLSICNGQLYDGPLKDTCASPSQVPGFFFRPLGKKDRASLSSGWLKKTCLSGG